MKLILKKKKDKNKTKNSLLYQCFGQFDFPPVFSKCPSYDFASIVSFDFCIVFIAVKIRKRAFETTTSLPLRNKGGLIHGNSLIKL